jgi:hypothetical protein
MQEFPNIINNRRWSRTTNVGQTSRHSQHPVTLIQSQKSQTEQGRTWRKTHTRNLWRELANTHQPVARYCKRSLQRVRGGSLSDKWHRIGDFIFEKLKKKNSWRKILKVPGLSIRPSTWWSSWSRTAHPTACPTSKMIYTSFGAWRTTSAASRERTRGRQVSFTLVFSQREIVANCWAAEQWGAPGRGTPESG